MTRTQEICKALLAKGIYAKIEGEWNHQEDGSVALANHHSVQVGHDYLMLTQNLYDEQGCLSGVRFVLDEATVDSIVEHMKKS